MHTVRIATAVALTALIAATGAHGQNIVTGKTIAQVWCANCHRINRTADSPAHDATPSFWSIARNPSTTAQSLATFLRARHGAMPDLNLSRSEIADVSAYILSLRSEPQ